MHEYLNRLNRLNPDEADLPRSARTWARVIQIAGAEVLEMRDPNSGQDPDPASKPRYQYVRAGGVLWTRRLPPAPLEAVADETPWTDGPAQWERLGIPICPSALYDYLESAADLPVAVLRRLPIYRYGREEYIIRGTWVPATDAGDVEIVYGPVLTAWWDVPLPPCPDCGSAVVWYEAGWVPGARRCMGWPDADGSYDVAGGCGSMYSMYTVAGRALTAEGR